MGETEGASHRKLVFTRACVHVSAGLNTDLKHKTAFIQLLSHWILRQFVGSDSNEHDAVRPESGCFCVSCVCVLVFPALHLKVKSQTFFHGKFKTT